MEADLIKDLWQTHDWKNIVAVNENLEPLVTHLVKSKPKGALKKIKTTEVLLMCISVLMLAALLPMVVWLYNDTVMQTCYIVVTLALLATIFWGVYKLRYLKKIDLATYALITTMGKVQRFRLWIIYERIISITGFFVVAPAAYVLLFRWTRNADALYYFEYAGRELSVTIIVGLVLSLVSYRTIYFRSIKKILKQLKEINAFKDEHAQ